MADIKKTIEVEIISNTGQVDKISGTLDDVKKKIDQISKAANGTIKFKIDGVEKTNDEIQKITNNTKKAEKEAKGLTDEYKNTAKAAGEAADETEKLGKNTKKASDGAKGGGGGGCPRVSGTKAHSQPTPWTWDRSCGDSSGHKRHRTIRRGNTAGRSSAPASDPVLRGCYALREAPRH